MGSPGTVILFLSEAVARSQKNSGCRKCLFPKEFHHLLSGRFVSFHSFLQFLCVTDERNYNDYLILIANSCS